MSLGGGPVVGGGSDFHVEIASEGWHEGDTTPVPQFVQGQGYTVAIDPAVPDSNEIGAEWRQYKEVWTYPPGTFKGYGVFVTLNDDPCGPYESFVRPPDASFNTEVKLGRFEADDLEELHYTTDHFIGTFYFGPTVEGDVNLSVTVTHAKYVNNQLTNERWSDSDTVKLNVVKPEGSIEILETGITGISLQSNAFWLQFDKDRGRPDPQGRDPVNAPHPGVKWRSHVADPSKRDGTTFGGDFLNVQTVNAYRGRSYTEGLLSGEYKQELIRLPKKTHPSWSLDTSFGFPGHTSETPGGAFLESNNSAVEKSPVGRWMTSADAPGQPLTFNILDDRGNHDTYAYWAVDWFLMTLMYQPPGDSIPVPISKFKWNWGGQAKRGENGWLPGTNPEPHLHDSEPNQSVDEAAIPSTSFPLWKHNIREFTGANPLVWVNMNY